MTALGHERETLLEICAGLDETEALAPSGCPGWTTKDVVAHLAALFWVVVDPAALPDVAGLPTERAQDVLVESRRSWSFERVRADYAQVSVQALARLAALETMEIEVSLGDLGTYAAPTLPTAFCFDHYVHIRADLFAPRGSLAGLPPASDASTLAAALDWVEAALPQQNVELVATLTGTVEIALGGPAARLLRVGSGDPMARITSDPAGFLRWVTQRAAWEDTGAAATGDETSLAVARRLRVF
ncbi:maleylpyruvate isomerase family mycothiol-dependent enzyme [Frankia sp. AgB1.9]|nr:maleylpyruvate isomerase family mycothiol-dependent enzyme [Frankia sp. AgW1.1]MBL7548213.1 maleylpyruvate isomerase family mycothiol-dependent enzyme [Frankia sp. AgB1.9]